MNIAELARKLRISPNELREKLPQLGFDIGLKAIKVDDQLASRIIRAWRDYQDRQKQKEMYLRATQKSETDEAGTRSVEIPSVLTVKDFAQILDLPVSQVITFLMKSGVMASLNQRIDYDTAAIVATDLGYETKEINLQDKVELDKAQRIQDLLKAEKKTEMQARAPIIVVMGHVDHGKTKILDTIRTTQVMEGESGGITQHIGAYQVEKNNRQITFIDTPGHEAFTAMRSRGAKVADIAILVVAATEGVMPQTVEALKIAQEAGVPILVAINKMDLPEANPDKVKQELSQYNLLPEEWGGKTIFVPVSAKTGENIDLLLEQVLLLADVSGETIKANPEGDFVGSVIEAHVDKGEGPVATVLVKNGTLKKGDCVIVDGVLYGRIRLMRNYAGKTIDQAGPSVPARILGLKIAPKVGDVLEVTCDPKKAKRPNLYAIQKSEESFIKNKNEESSTETSAAVLNLVLRTDVLGSQEAIIESLKKMETADFKINIVTKGLGSVTENDIMTAEATNSMLFSFNVLNSPAVLALAKEKNLPINNYKVIYQLLDKVKEELKAIAKSETVRVDLGRLQILAVFKRTDKGLVLGGKVLSGVLEPNATAAILRGEEFVASGKITELRSGKQLVNDVAAGQECGLSYEGQPVVEVGDILDVYREKEVKKTI